MENSASPWQHTAIPLDTAISKRADASLNAPFVRLWQAFLSGRVLLALALILLQAMNLQLQNLSSPIIWLICCTYLALTIVLRLTANRNLPAPKDALQWFPVIGVDIAVIFLLQIFQVGALNYTALLAIPILISAALGGLMLALGTTASITLLTLAYTFWKYQEGFSDAAQSFYQVAFSCAGYFCIAYLTHELAKRVRRERSVVQLK